MAVEARRRCGYRKIGGTYLVSDAVGFACGRLPLDLIPCPLCEHRPAFTRGLQRITPANILHAVPICPGGNPARCAACPLGKAMGAETAGLMWVGDRFYTPTNFTAEMEQQGVSKRIPHIPRWLIVGTTWVFLASMKARASRCLACNGTGAIESATPQDDVLFAEIACEACDGIGWRDVPAVFSAFVPTRIERIIPDTMPEADREALRAQGLTLVEVPANDPDHAPSRTSKDDEA